MALPLVLAALVLGMWPGADGFCRDPGERNGPEGVQGQAAPQDLETLDKALAPGLEALERLLPRAQALAAPMSREVLDGRADLHVFYGMVVGGLIFEQCRDTLSLLRAARAQDCPALTAALTQRLAEAAGRLDGAAELVEGGLGMVTRPDLALLGREVARAMRLYAAPLAAFAADPRRREL